MIYFFGSPTIVENNKKLFCKYLFATKLNLKTYFGSIWAVPIDHISKSIFSETLVSNFHARSTLMKQFPSFENHSHYNLENVEIQPEKRFNSVLRIALLDYFFSIRSPPFITTSCGWRKSKKKSGFTKLKCVECVIIQFSW